MAKLSTVAVRGHPAQTYGIFIHSSFTVSARTFSVLKTCKPGGTEMVDSLMITSWYHFNADNSVFSKDVVAQKNPGTSKDKYLLYICTQGDQKHFKLEVLSQHPYSVSL